MVYSMLTRKAMTVHFHLHLGKVCLGLASRPSQSLSMVSQVTALSAWRRQGWNRAPLATRRPFKAMSALGEHIAARGRRAKLSHFMC